MDRASFIEYCRQGLVLGFSLGFLSLAVNYIAVTFVRSFKAATRIN